MRYQDAAPRTAATGIGRRQLLAAGVGVGAVALTGCSLNNPFDSSQVPAAKATADLAPDVALAVNAVGILLETDTHARDVVARFPGLATRLAGVITLHQAHLDALRAAVPHGVDPTPSSTIAPPPATRKAALRDQRAREQALHDRLTGLALRAESGPFARLLGSMAAAVSQQLVELVGPGGAS